MMTNEGYVIQHHGILGQKWGVRRFQNTDGSLTDSGKKRYSTGENGRYESNKTRRLKKAIDSENRDITNLAQFRESGISTKSGKQVLTSEDIDKQISGIEKVRNKNQVALEKSQKRDAKKAESLDIRKNMSVGKKAAMYALAGAMGPTNWANYKAAGYSDRKATVQSWLDWYTGANITGRSARVRNKSADNS